MIKKTKTVAISKAQRSLSALIKEVGSGREVVLTKRGVPVARLVSSSIPNKTDWKKFDRNLARFRKKIRGPFLRKGETWKDYTHGW